MTDEIVIRRARSPEDYRACQEAQLRAWGLAEDGYVVPIATMVGAQHHGGLVLGAFLADGSAAGMSFAFLGRVEDRPCLYSQLTGIIPGYQDRGLGTRMKLAQRDLARAEGIRLIAWAFDPLQAGNARFNLDKLGATCGQYVVDMYGPRTDALNRGTPTDRLIAEWPTDPDHRPTPPGDDVLRRPRLIAIRLDADGRIEPADVSVPDAESSEVLLEIPADATALRAADPGLADRWRLAVRAAFESAFAAGYRASGFVRFEDEGVRRAAYVLHRASPTP